MEITIGMKGEAWMEVEKEDTAQIVGSGSLLVYATPCMAALMEGAACEALEGFLSEDQTTVGIELNLKHVAATPVGMEVRAEAEVTAVEGKIITFGAHTKSADYAANNISTNHGMPCFDIVRNGEFLCHIQLNVPGTHNIYNALAAAVAASLCRISPKHIAEALGHFAGAKRRMEYKGTFHGADVYDDYAHHPTEIAATLDGVARMGYDRVFCVFQPHTYTRTKALFDDFVV